jgi:hypothetical protein
MPDLWFRNEPAARGEMGLFLNRHSSGKKYKWLYQHDLRRTRALADRLR